MSILKKIIGFISWTNIIDKFTTKDVRTSTKSWNDIIDEIDPIINRPIEHAFKDQPDLTVSVEVPKAINIQPVFEPDTGPKQHQEKFISTKDDFFKFEIVNNKLTTFWTKPDTFKVSSWREQNKAAAKLLLDTYEDALTIFYDGSLESQIMLLSFNDAGKIPRVYSTNLEEALKDQALVHLHRTFSFPLRIISLSNEFWKRRSIELSVIHNVKNPLTIKRLWASTAASGIPIIANGIPNVQFLDGKPILVETISNLALEKLVLSNNSTVIPAFFRYTPEQIMTFLILVQTYLTKSYQAHEDKSPDSRSIVMLKLFQDSYPELCINDMETVFPNDGRNIDLINSGRYILDILPIN